MNIILGVFIQTWYSSTHQIYEYLLKILIDNSQTFMVSETGILQISS